MPPSATSTGATPARIVVMGVSGSGKSTVGRALADHMGLPFADADDLHPPANVAKMATGQPLDDDDRAPWLLDVGAWIVAQAHGGVIGCSALRRSYRDVLRTAAPGTVFLHLTGDPRLLTRRVGTRADHFMPASLVASQLATLEPLEADEAGVAVDFGEPVKTIVETFSAATT